MEQASCLSETCKVNASKLRTELTQNLYPSSVTFRNSHEIPSLQYSLGSERSYLWAVSKTSINSYELPPAAEIETAAKQFYELLKTPGFQLELRSCTNSDNPPGVKTPGSQLKSSKDDSTRVSVHLSGLELLAQSLKIHSATTLGIIRQEQATRKTAPKAIAILADPVFSSDDERVTNNKQKSDRS